jgi:polyisoprenoid-binding protein YceI
VRVEVDLASVDTGIEDRDDHLRTADFFDVATHPTATVRVHTAEKLGATEEGHDHYRAFFDFDLHGVQKTLPGEFTVRSVDPFVVEGRVKVNRLDFGIGEPRTFWNPLSISEKVPVTFRAAIPARD